MTEASPIVSIDYCKYCLALTDTSYEGLRKSEVPFIKVSIRVPLCWELTIFLGSPYGFREPPISYKGPR